MKIGIDEVGRGCLAGDLIVVAYSFKPNLTEKELIEVKSLCKDSKSFSSQKSREKVFEKIKNSGVYHISRRNPDDIDRLNIRGATLDAMKESCEFVSHKLYEMTKEPSHCVFDGNVCPSGLNLSPKSSFEFLIKGDSKLEEIGAASILAKVTRDREMIELDTVYPGYQFFKNAGYGTKAHREALAKLGMTPIHRSWALKFCS